MGRRREETQKCVALSSDPNRWRGPHHRERLPPRQASGAASGAEAERAEQQWGAAAAARWLGRGRAPPWPGQGRAPPGRRGQAPPWPAAAAAARRGAGEAGHNAGPGPPSGGATRGQGRRGRGTAQGRGRGTGAGASSRRRRGAGAGLGRLTSPREQAIWQVLGPRRRVVRRIPAAWPRQGSIGGHGGTAVARALGRSGGGVGKGRGGQPPRRAGPVAGAAGAARAGAARRFRGRRRGGSAGGGRGFGFACWRSV